MGSGETAVKNVQVDYVCTCIGNACRLCVTDSCLDIVQQRLQRLCPQVRQLHAVPACTAGGLDCCLAGIDSEEGVGMRMRNLSLQQLADHEFHPLVASSYMCAGTPEACH